MSKNRCARIVALWFLTGATVGCGADAEPSTSGPGVPDGAAGAAGASGAGAFAPGRG